MNIKTLIAASGLALMSSSASFAAPVNIIFSISDFSGSVSGTIFGLDDEAVVLQSATSISGTSTFHGDFDFFAISDTFFFNDFGFVGGVLDYALLSVDDAFSPDRFKLKLYSNTFIANEGRLGTRFSPFQVVGPVQYTAVAAVPLPAGGLLLLSGLAGVAAIRRRKKRAA